VSVRYSPLFKFPRKLIKSFFVAVYPVVIRIWSLPKVLSIEETINLILQKQTSIARFGDGEFLYIIDKINLPFQYYDERLAQMLKEILKYKGDDLLVGLPSGYHGMKTLNREGRNFWKSQISWVYPRLRKYLRKDKVYVNASITRLYHEIEDKQLSAIYFSMIKRVWDGRDVLIIEGSKSRLGVGNNLLQSAKSVRRILAPVHNAFDAIEQIQEAAVMHARKGDLILVALGPTAKVAAFLLSRKGFQVVDIGNLDIEYEWFLNGATSKIKVQGKYTSEAVGGRNVEDIHDRVYETQIIANLENANSERSHLFSR
jgi:glycosyltransferase family protein